MWLFSIFNLLYVFCLTFLPAFLDTGLQVDIWIIFSHSCSNTPSLQVWNGIVINSTDFGRTAEWSKESPVVVQPENIPGPVRNAPQSANDSSIKFPDPALEQENLLPRNLQVGDKFLRFEISPDVDALWPHFHQQIILSPISLKSTNYESHPAKHTFIVSKTLLSAFVLNIVLSSETSKTLLSAQNSIVGL